MAEHEQLCRPVPVQQPGGVPAARQAIGVPLEGGDLTAEVVIPRPGRLDDDPPAAGVGVENNGFRQVPAHVAAYPDVR